MGEKILLPPIPLATRVPKFRQDELDEQDGKGTQPDRLFRYVILFILFILSKPAFCGRAS
ncbi:MAG: hypothetical protein EBS05_17215 [Proteobacteria bacterium]|nr:hypothetical protein [Pseudomonadota bacterium]